MHCATDLRVWLTGSLHLDPIILRDEVMNLLVAGRDTVGLFNNHLGLH